MGDSAVVQVIDEEEVMVSVKALTSRERRLQSFRPIFVCDHHLLAPSSAHTPYLSPNGTSLCCAHARVLTLT